MINPNSKFAFQISGVLLLLVVPAVLSGHFAHPGYPRIQYIQAVSPRPIVAIVHDGVYIPNRINPPEPVRGYLTADGQFTMIPGPIRGIYLFGGVFYPGGNNDTPQRGTVAGVVQVSTFTRNDNDVRPRAFGHMANGRFYEGNINNVPASEPGQRVPGNFAAGGVFFPDPDIPKVAPSTQFDANFPVAGSPVIQSPLSPSNNFLRFQ